MTEPAGDRPSEASPSGATPGGDSVTRNAAFAFAAQMVTASATAALTIFLVRRLGPTDFGVFTLALAVSGLLILPSDFGVSASTARFVAERRRDSRAAGALLAAALRLKLVVSGLVSIGLIALAGPVAAALDTPALEWPLRAISIALAAQSFLQLFTNMFVALGRVSLSLRAISSEAMMEASASALIVLLGGGVTGATFGRAIGYTFGALIGLVLALRLIGVRNVRRAGPPPVERRRLAGYAGALLIIDGAYSLLGSSGTILIGALLDAKAVGLFSPPMRLITFLHYPGYAISTGVAPRLARGEHSEPDVPALLTSLRYLLLFQTVLVAPTVVWAHPLTELVLGPGYGKSADVLMAIAPYTFLSGFAPVLSLSVNYLGEARRRVPISLTTLALSVGISLALIPAIGIVGVAVATDASYAFYVLGHLWICNRLLDIDLRPLGGDLLRCLVAAGAMAAVLAVFGVHHLAIWQIVVGGALATAVYLAALVVTGAASKDELRQALEALRRRVRGGSRAPVVR